jgi:hypothetical protein
MVEGLVEASVEGTPQGGPLSPLLANIYLDALDKELDRRGHAYCRYADDCNIYVSSRAAAERTLTSIQGWKEEHLRLKVNTTKSGTGRVWERKFLGFRLNRALQTGIAPESVERFKAKVRELWRSRQSVSGNELRDRWRSVICRVIRESKDFRHLPAPRVSGRRSAPRSLKHPCPRTAI